jgi:hypothetical protein
MSNEAVSGERPLPSVITSPVTGRVDFGWISEAWRLFSRHAGVWVGATLIFIAPSVVFGIGLYAYMLATMFPHGFTAPSAVPGSALPPSNPFSANPFLVGSNFGKILTIEIGFGLLFAVWSAYLYGGLFRMAVRQVRGLPIEFRDIFSGGVLFGRMLGAMFLLGFGTYGLEALCLGPLGILAWQKASTAATVISGGLGILVFSVCGLALTGLLLPSFALLADGESVFVALRRSIQGMRGAWAPAMGFVLVVGLLVYASDLPCGLGLLVTIPMVFLMTALAYRDMLGMPNMVPPPMPYYPTANADVWPPPPQH